MCGIIGIAGKTTTTNRLVDGLRRLEYRGYDSAGIATLESHKTERRRAVGKLDNLYDLLKRDPLDGPIGIGHTRWATHGKTTLENAHPHMSGKVTLVHNGIIENYRDIKTHLQTQNLTPAGETDTEILACLIDFNLSKTSSPKDAIIQTLDMIDGAFALAVMINGQDDTIYCARRGAPLVIGYGEGENYIGSDALALSGLSNNVCYLEEGDWAIVTPDSVVIFDTENTVAQRQTHHTQNTGALVSKGNYQHFMLKEIHEQPTVVAQTLSPYVDFTNADIKDIDLPFDLSAIPRITLIACGTSFYAAMVAKYWFEQIAKVPVDVDIASEFRYRDPLMTAGGLTLLISQSGETADTLAALKHAKDKGQYIASIVNVKGSSMARLSDMVFETHAGPEIGVASTKAFTCQLATLASLVLLTAKKKRQISELDEQHYIKLLEELPNHLAASLKLEDSLKATSKQLAKARDVLFLGRGTDYPIAMEGALKLKEISYIHAEGYAAGEMKHGPIALIDEDVPIIVLAPSGELFEKTVSNMQEVMARGGKVILISDEDGIRQQSEGTFATITIPKVDPFISPIIYAIPVQLLAYYTAVAKGTDVDQPRNLAKSVTVE